MAVCCSLSCVRLFATPWNSGVGSHSFLQGIFPNQGWNLGFCVAGGLFSGSSAGKESTCNAGDPRLISGLERFPGEGNGYPLQCSGLENSVACIVHGVTESHTRLSDFHYNLKHWSPTFLAPGTSFVEHNYFTDWEGRMVWA